MSATHQVLTSAGASVAPTLLLVRESGRHGPAERFSRTAQPSISAIEQSDLRGMGGAGFPTHRKWADDRGA